MAVLSVYIINKAGGLIYQYDHNSSRPEIEKTFGYPLEVVLKVHDDKVVVAFGERDAIKGLFLPYASEKNISNKCPIDLPSTWKIIANWTEFFCLYNFRQIFMLYTKELDLSC